MDFDLVSLTKNHVISKTRRASIHNMELKSNRSSKPTASQMHKIKLPGSHGLRQYLIDAEKRKKRRFGGSIRKSNLAFGISKCASQEMSVNSSIMAEIRSVVAVTKRMSQ